jgi:hypothetical protein
MGHEPAADHLLLWRGIDDAVWREALRRVPPARPPPRVDNLWRAPRAPQPARPKVPEPA